MPRATRGRSRRRKPTLSVDDMIMSIRSGSQAASSFRKSDLQSMARALEIDLPNRALKGTIVELIENALGEGQMDDDSEGNASNEGVAGIGSNGAHDYDNGNQVRPSTDHSSLSEEEPSSRRRRDPGNSSRTPSPDDYNMHTPSGEHVNDNASEQHSVEHGGTESSSSSAPIPDGCIIIPHDLYERTLEVTRQNAGIYCVDINNPEQKVMRFLYERARGNLDSPEAYKSESMEERAQKAAARIMGVVVPYIEEYVGDASVFNQDVDPNLCRLEENASAGIEKEVRVLKLRFPKYWQSLSFNLPPPFFSRSEKLQFDADSSRVVDEVRRSIQSLIRRNVPPGGRWTTKPGIDMVGDQIELFYLLNEAGDVVLLNKHFLKRCPLMDWDSGKTPDGPTFYVCKFRHPYRHDRHNALPHFQVFQKSGLNSYLYRLVFLILLAYLLVEASPGTNELQLGPYLPSVSLPDSLDYGVDAINTTTRVLIRTGQNIWIKQSTYRACTLRSSLDAVSDFFFWLVGYVGGNQETPIDNATLGILAVPAQIHRIPGLLLFCILILAEWNILWIRSRFCILSLSWLVLRRYIFVIFPSPSKLGASPVDIHNEQRHPLHEDPGHEGQCQRLRSWLKLIVQTPTEWKDHLATAWNFLLSDDWLGYNEGANSVKRDAASRNEGVAQIVYEDEQVFRWFTYRWCPSQFDDSEDKDKWLQTLRSVCGMPEWKKVSTQPDLIFSSMNRPGLNRVISHQFLQKDPMIEGVTSPIEEHPVLYVHPPATRSRPASLTSHFRLIIPWYPLMCFGTWGLFIVLSYFPSLNSSKCQHLHASMSDGPSGGITNWRFYWRGVLGFCWINTASALINVLQSDAASVFSRWLNRDPLLGMYGGKAWKLQPTDITAEEKSRRTLRTQLWFVFSADAVLLCMANNEISLMKGVVVLLLVCILTYGYGFGHINRYNIKMAGKAKQEARRKHILNATVPNATDLAQKSAALVAQLNTCKKIRLAKLRECIRLAGIVPAFLVSLFLIGKLSPHFPVLFAVALSTTTGTVIGLAGGLVTVFVDDVSSRWLIRIFVFMFILTYLVHSVHAYIEKEPELGIFFSSIGCFTGGLIVDWYIWHWAMARLNAVGKSLYNSRWTLLMFITGALAIWLIKAHFWDDVFGDDPGASMALGAMTSFIVVWMPLAHFIQFLNRDNA